MPHSFALPASSLLSLTLFHAMPLLLKVMETATVENRSTRNTWPLETLIDTQQPKKDQRGGRRGFAVGFFYYYFFV